MRFTLLLISCWVVSHGWHVPGAASGSTDLLPAPSPSTNWTASLLTDSGRDSDLIYRFDGHQAANVPDTVDPQNLTDQFTIATWMKHGPSPGLRAEKETLLCKSDKTGKCTPLNWFACICLQIIENCGSLGFFYWNIFYKLELYLPMFVWAV